MAGLIGASNSPVSGIGILAIIASSLLLVGLLGRGGGEEASAAMVAYALIVTGIVFGIATISNDNLQDLKTGQLVGATPWKQQVALIIGVIFGSLVVPPVLNVLNETVGFVGVPGAGPNALAAPQAGLISSLAKGVLGGDLNWTMLGYGVLAGIGFIFVDELLGRLGKLRLPPLAIGIGIYLPMAVILPVVLGAIGGWYYDRWASRRANPGFAHRMGVLTATGMIVGESLFGVFYAGTVYLTDNDAPLAVVGDGFALPSIFVGVGLFAVLLWHSYARTRRAVVAAEG
jgi:putative OPT family oligopeptide transporter